MQHICTNYWQFECLSKFQLMHDWQRSLSTCPGSTGFPALFRTLCLCRGLVAHIPTPGSALTKTDLPQMSSSWASAIVCCCFHAFGDKLTQGIESFIRYSITPRWEKTISCRHIGGDVQLCIICGTQSGRHRLHHLVEKYVTFWNRNNSVSIVQHEGKNCHNLLLAGHLPDIWKFW